LRRGEAVPSAVSPHPTSMEITQKETEQSTSADTTMTANAGPAVADSGAAVSATLTLTPNKESKTTASIDLPDPALFARLSPSSRSALERANGMRGALGQDRVHMEHLVGGLFEKPDGPTQRLLRKANIDEPKLLQIVESAVGTALPVYSTIALAALPPLSPHVEEAIREAVRRADDSGSKLIRSRHLLYGVLWVDECTLVQALVERGVRKEDLDQIGDGREDPDKPLLESKVSQVEAPPETEHTALGATPTPRVDSDLWSEDDRLGYEAYARTIASLITHKETKPPLAIGIKAPWGAGKTTLMKRVQHLLDGDAR